MILAAILFQLMAINFNVAAANPHGTINSSKHLNGLAVICQWGAIITVLVAVIFHVVQSL